MGLAFSDIVTPHVNAIAEHPLVQAIHPRVMEVTWESDDDVWWDAFKTKSYDLTVGPWSMLGKGILDFDRLMYH